MLKRVEVVQWICDVCNKNDTFSGCMHCGKDFCYDCRKTHALELPHSLWCTGSYDGLYCNECRELPELLEDPLYKAYVAIRDLRQQSDDVNTRIRETAKQHEDTIQRLYQEFDNKRRQERADAANKLAEAP